MLTGKTRKELGVSFRNMLSELVSKLDEMGWDIGEGVLMRTFLVISTGEPRFSKARKILNELSASKIKGYLEDLHDVLTYAVDRILKRELNIKETFLP